MRSQGLCTCCFPASIHSRAQSLGRQTRQGLRVPRDRTRSPGGRRSIRTCTNNSDSPTGHLPWPTPREGRPGCQGKGPSPPPGPPDLGPLHPWALLQAPHPGRGCAFHPPDRRKHQGTKGSLCPPGLQLGPSRSFCRAMRGRPLGGDGRGPSAGQEARPEGPWPLWRLGWWKGPWGQQGAGVHAVGIPGAGPAPPQPLQALHAQHRTAQHPQWRVLPVRSASLCPKRLLCGGGPESPLQTRPCPVSAWGAIPLVAAFACVCSTKGS